VNKIITISIRLKIKNHHPFGGDMIFYCGYLKNIVLNPYISQARFVQN